VSNRAIPAWSIALSITERFFVGERLAAIAAATFRGFDKRRSFQTGGLN
jgi:hypothetical protein